MISRRVFAAALAGLLIAGSIVVWRISASAGRAGGPRPAGFDTSAYAAVRSVEVAADLAGDVSTLAAQQGHVQSRGLWENYDRTQWRVASGPALVAAVAASATGNNAEMLYIAVRTFNTLIDNHLEANGSLGYTGQPGGDAIDTMFFATNLGMAVRTLGSRLPPATRLRWVQVVVGAARYLVSSGNLKWYANGNIVLGNTLLMALAYDLTGQTEWYSYYQETLAFAIHPLQSRWPGFGLIITKPPSVPGASDGSGYFAETEGGAPGFDADYTQVQLAQLTRLYLVTGSAEVLHLMDLLFNQEWPRVNRSTWALDTSGGTRRPQLDRYVPFLSPALEVLAVYGGRKLLTPYIRPHVAYIEKIERSVVTEWSPAAYDYYGLDSAPLGMLSDRAAAFPLDGRHLGA